MQQGPSFWLNRLREWWQHITKPQKIALIAGSIITMALVIGVVVWSQQTQYDVLFSNLQPTDASNIVNVLKGQKIPYEISDNGTVILVPASVVDSTRLMLAGQGLPSQGVVGFEIFDKTNPLNLTDFLQQVDYQRALEGQLTRTIENINGVQQASVSIVLPQSSLYTSTQDSATASVMLQLTPGASLQTSQVNAIMHLVASSVQGLTPQNVTVVDSNGNNLSQVVLDSSLANGVNSTTYGTAMQVQQQYEQTLSLEAQSMLNSILGPGKSVVRVNASLNWDQLQQDTTTYSPTPSAIASQSINNITSNGQGTVTPSGVPGTASNLVPTPTAAAGASSGNQYVQNQSQTTYDVTQTVQHLIKAPGSIQRLTVAVVLNGTYSPATLSSVQSAVANAIGLDTTRGDQITVTAMPFSNATSAATQSALKTQQQNQLTSILLQGIALAIVALALLIFAFRATRRTKSKATTTVTLVDDKRIAIGLDGKPLTESEMLVANGAASLPSGDKSLVTIGANGQIEHHYNEMMIDEAEQARQQSLKENLMDLAREHPEMLANVIVGWYEEG